MRGYPFPPIVLLLLAGLSWSAPDFSLVGFGAAATGGSGTPVTVTDYAGLKSAAEAGGKIVYVNGTIYNGEKGGIINVKSNTSIIGVGTNAFFNGVGINIKGVSNVVVRNVKMTMKGITYRGTDDLSIYDPDGDEGRPQIKLNDGDCIHIEGASYDIWVDHSEFYAEDPAVQTNQDLYDGLLDAKSESQRITVSWNYFHDHHKTSLIGSSDSDTKDRKMTFHHNYYYNVKERLPSYRGGTAHVYSSYFKHIKGGAINTRVNACVYVEENVFDDVAASIYSKNSSIIGYAKSVNNLFQNGSAGAESQVTSSYDSKCSAFLKPSYTYKTTAAADVVSEVTTYAGVGKIDGGTSSAAISSSVMPSSSSSSKPVSSSAIVSSSASQPTSSATVSTGSVQAENFCTANGVGETKNGGFNGAGYLNLDPNNGAAAMWALYATKAGEVTLGVRYANGSTADRPMIIANNGKTAVASASFPATGAWTTWDVLEYKVSLEQGRNEITFKSLGTDGPNIDEIAFSDASIIASCTEPTTQIRHTSVRSDLGALKARIYDILGRRK